MIVLTGFFKHCKQLLSRTIALLYPYLEVVCVNKAIIVGVSMLVTRLLYVWKECFKRCTDKPHFLTCIAIGSQSENAMHDEFILPLTTILLRECEINLQKKNSGPSWYSNQRPSEYFRLLSFTINNIKPLTHLAPYSCELDVLTVSILTT